MLERLHNLDQSKLKHGRMTTQARLIETNYILELRHELNQSKQLYAKLVK